MSGPPERSLLPPEALRVFTFNIRNGRALNGRNLWWCRRRRVLDSIVRLDADIVALQEVYAFQRRWLQRRLPAYDAYGVGRSDGARKGEHVVVLYRRDRFERADATTRWFGPTPDTPGSGWDGADFPRTAAIVSLLDRTAAAGAPRPIVFANTHLHARNNDHRLASARQLLTWLAASPDPVIVAGDLNDDPDGPVLSVLEEGGLRPAVGADAGGSNHDFTGRTDGRRIDHVLVGQGWSVLGGWVDHRLVDGRVASDHWPVGADLLAPAPPPPSR